VLKAKQRTPAFPASLPHDEGMPTDRSSLYALKNLISEVDLILETAPDLPQNRTARSRELLSVAISLADDLISQAKMPAATAMGHKGGTETARKRESMITDHVWEVSELLT
jgi:hypothetical protein